VRGQRRADACGSAQQAEIQAKSLGHQALDALHFGGAHFLGFPDDFGGVEAVHDAFLFGAMQYRMDVM
jgi:hypothetical protein